MERAVASHTHGRCPACRTQYDESTIRFSAPSDAELAAESERLRLKKEKDPDGFTTVSKGSNRKQTLNPKPQTLNTLTLMQRKRLFDVRVIRRNLVYVVGVTPRFCHEKQLHDLSIFQKYGAVLKIHATPPKPNSVLPTGSAYVTFDNDQRYVPAFPKFRTPCFTEAGDCCPYIEIYMALTLFWQNVKSAALCIRGVDGTALDGKTLRASFGTTKVRGFPNHHVPPYAIIAPDGRCAVLFDCTVRT
jgi:CCR4-NOT transcription complex subunit 4